MNKQMHQQMNELQSKFDEANRTLNDLDASKKKLTIENSDYLRQLEDAESQVAQLNKLKVSLTTQLEDTKRMADEENRERATLLGKFRNLEHDIDGLREQLEEEAEGKADLQRQLSKCNAESQMWRQKYENEGVARAEELEESKYVVDPWPLMPWMIWTDMDLLLQEEASGSPGRSWGSHRISECQGCRSWKGQAASGWWSRRHASRGRARSVPGQPDGEARQELRQGHRRMEGQGWRHVRRTWRLPEGMPQLLHWTLPSQDRLRWGSRAHGVGPPREQEPFG